VQRTGVEPGAGTEAAVAPSDYALLKRRVRDAGLLRKQPWYYALCISANLSMLAVCLLLLVLGGVSLDLWRAFSQRQALAGLADAAALAGASGIDRAAARRGVIRLDPAEATSLANRSIEGQADRGSLVSSNVTVSQDGSEVTVSADGRVLLTLLRLVSGQGPIAVHVSSTALAGRSP